MHNASAAAVPSVKSRLDAAFYWLRGGYNGEHLHREILMAARTMEQRGSDREAMVDDIPRLINIRFAHAQAQLDGLDARVSTVEAKIDRISFELQAVKSEVQALPRILADMLDERAKQGG